MNIWLKIDKILNRKFAQKLTKIWPKFNKHLNQNSRICVTTTDSGRKFQEEAAPTAPGGTFGQTADRKTEKR